MKVNGIDKVIAKLKSLPVNVQVEIKDVIEDTVSGIEQDAIKNIDRVPHNKKELVYEASVDIRKRIKSELKHEGFVGAVHVDAGPMAAYIEFGTGLSAAQYVPTLPPEWQAKAIEFYINGKGTIAATPYLYPAYFKHTKDFTKKIREAVKRGAEK